MALSFRNRRASQPASRTRRWNPFLVSLLILAGGIALYYLVQALFFSSAGTAAEVQLKIPESGTVYVEFAGESDFRAVSTSTFRFLENETVQSKTTENAYLDFFEGSRIFLDEQSELHLEKSRQHSGDEREIAVNLQQGQIWAEVTPSFNPRSKFTIQVGQNLILESQNGTFAVNLTEGTVKVSKGSVRVSQEENGAQVFYQDVGVGQQFSFSGNISENKLAMVVNDAWFTAHQENADTPGDIPENPDELPGDTDTGTSITPSTVSILIPGKNGSTVTVTKNEQEISGTVPSGTAKVVVNDYTLQKFKAGDSIFKYTATVTFGSLKKGTNEYTVEAFDAKNELLGDAKITIMYAPELSSIEPTPDEDTPTKPITGTLAITSPSAATTYTAKSSDPVVLSGTAPSNAAKIMVNGYTLTKYVAGSSTWSYRISADLGNMKAGANTYDVKAVDSSGKTLATDSITITFPEATPTPPKTEEKTPVSPEPAATGNETTPTGETVLRK